MESRNEAGAMSVTDDVIANVAAEIDHAAGKSIGEQATTPSSNRDEKDPTSMAQMIKTMSKTPDGTNVIKESIKTFSNPDGSDKKGDVIFPRSDIDGALTMLKTLIDTSKEKSKPGKKKAKWDFSTCPHGQFGKTLDDLFLTFLIWAKVFSDGNEYFSKVNVSKAFRRLEKYADWMEDSNNDLAEPLTPESVWEALDVWKMKASVDKNGRFVWWISFSDIDAKKVKKFDSKDHIRAFVWYSHYVMFDENAQENGIVFIEDCDHVGFLESMTLIPMKVGAKLDRLTIGTLPVQVKSMLLLECPGWINLFMKFLKMFMSKKLKERIQIVKDWASIEEEVGIENIPVGFGKLKGSLAVDPIIDKYFREQVSEQ